MSLRPHFENIYRSLTRNFCIKQKQKSVSGEYRMYQFIPLQRDYRCETSLKANVAIDEGKDRNET